MPRFGRTRGACGPKRSAPQIARAAKRRRAHARRGSRQVFRLRAPADRPSRPESQASGEVVGGGPGRKSRSQPVTAARPRWSWRDVIQRITTTPHHASLFNPAIRKRSDGSPWAAESRQRAFSVSERLWAVVRNPSVHSREPLPPAACPHSGQAALLDSPARE